MDSEEDAFPDSPPESKGLRRNKKPAVITTVEPEKTTDLSDSGRFQKGLIQIHSRGLVVGDVTTNSDADSSLESGRVPSTVTFELGPEDFENLEVVGHGASSYVRKALHKKSQTVMALKVINVFDKEKRKQLMTEIQTLFNAECPQMITFHGAFSHEGSISIALEYATAGSLSDLVRLSGGVSEKICALITEQILLGFRFMHKDRHQIHRDFKPSNLLLDHSGRVLLTDFGVATTLNDSAAMCATFVGTYLYMSPERFSGEKYSFAVDIWSLGLVVLEMMTSQYPWVNKGYWDLMNNIVNEPPPHLPNDKPYSNEIADFIGRCLVKEPDKRANVLELMDHPFIVKNCGPLSQEDKQNEIARWIASCRTVFIALKDPKVPAEVGHEFILLFHSIFTCKRHLLASLYNDESVFEYNGKIFQGRDAIMEALMGIELLLLRDESIDWKSCCSFLNPRGEDCVISVKSKGAVSFHDQSYIEEYVLVEEKSKSCFWVSKQVLSIS